MKKIISLILSAALLITCLCLPAYAAENKEKTALQFNKNGKFTILNISDIQDGYPLNPLT